MGEKTIDRERVTEWFALYSALEGAGLARWLPLCGAAAARLERRLRKDADVDGQMERLCGAAGALAYCDWLMLGTGASGEEVRVGGISLKSTAGDKAAGAAQIRGWAEAEIADLLEDAGFLLRAVGGTA